MAMAGSIHTIAQVLRSWLIYQLMIFRLGGFGILNSLPYLNLNKHRMFSASSVQWSSMLTHLPCSKSL